MLRKRFRTFALGLTFATTCILQVGSFAETAFGESNAKPASPKSLITQFETIKKAIDLYKDVPVRSSAQFDLEHFLNENPASEFEPEGEYWLASMRFLSRQYDDARTAYRRYLSSVGKRDFSDSVYALAFMAEAYYLDKSFDQVLPVAAELQGLRGPKIGDEVENRIRQFWVNSLSIIAFAKLDQFELVREHKRNQTITLEHIKGQFPKTSFLIPNHPMHEISLLEWVESRDDFWVSSMDCIRIQKQNEKIQPRNENEYFKQVREVVTCTQSAFKDWLNVESKKLNITGYKRIWMQEVNARLKSVLRSFQMTCSKPNLGLLKPNVFLVKELISKANTDYCNGLRNDIVSGFNRTQKSVWFNRKDWVSFTK